MPNKKKYRIWCNTEAANVSGYSNLDDPPSSCPNNPAHSVNSNTKCVTEVLCIDNLTATTDPGVNDGIDAGYGVGSRWVNTLTANEFSCVDSAVGAAVWIKTRKDVFGTEYNYAASEGESSTTSGTPQNKVTLSVDVPAGNYRVTWHWGVKAATAKKIAGRVIQDDVTELSSFWFNYYTEYYPIAGMAQVTLTAGAHTFKIDHWSPDGATTSYIRRARIALWRVG